MNSRIVNLEKNEDLRPVISMLGTSEYKLANYLDGFIKLAINVTYSVDSIGAFMNKLQNFQFCESDDLASFEFIANNNTNVLLDEMKRLIAECVNGDSYKRVPHFQKSGS